MSGIRVNEWLHNSGTGGIWQTSAGNVGIASSVPTTKLEVTGDAKISGVTTATAFIPTEGYSNKKNLLDNGEFIVDQRMGGSATAITPSGGVDYTCDRWHESNYGGEAGRITFQTINSDVPNANYRQSIKLDCTTAMGAPSGNNYMCMAQFVEAQDIRFLGHGTANAKPITLQFWIKSTKTGTSSVTILRHDASREYVAEYTISSSDTWEKKTITIPGDTTGTEAAMDNGRGWKVSFTLFAGSSRHGTLNEWRAQNGGYTGASSNQVNLIDSTSNNIFFTGIQIEVGEVATPFEYRSYGDELERCRRYYQVLVDAAGSGTQFSFGNATCYNSSSIHFVYPLSPEMRTTPTLDYTTGTDYYRAYQNGTNDPFDTWSLVGNSHPRCADLMASSGVSVTAAASALLRTGSTASKIAFTADL